MDDPWSERGVVETYTGGQFDLFDPDPAVVRLADIAAGLAHTCRFGGQCRQFYSVARHSLHVSRELPDDPRLRLLADEAANILEDGSWAGNPPDLGDDLQSGSISAVRTGSTSGPKRCWSGCRAGSAARAVTVRSGRAGRGR